MFSESKILFFLNFNSAGVGTGRVLSVQEVRNNPKSLKIGVFVNYYKECLPMKGFLLLFLNKIS